MDDPLQTQNSCKLKLRFFMTRFHKLALGELINRCLNLNYIRRHKKKIFRILEIANKKVQPVPKVETL